MKHKHQRMKTDLNEESKNLSSTKKNIKRTECSYPK